MWKMLENEASGRKIPALLEGEDVCFFSLIRSAHGFQHFYDICTALKLNWSCGGYTVSFYA